MAEVGPAPGLPNVFGPIQWNAWESHPSMMYPRLPFCDDD
jgi:hypothetical protein